MRTIAEVTDIVSVKMFSYTNKSGGTEMAQTKMPVKCRLIKAWEDYECGWRYHAEPVAEQPALESYLQEHARSRTMYVSEFDILTIEPASADLN